MPSIIGTANRNIIVVPCTLKIWLYLSRTEKRVVGLRELQAHQQRFDAAGQQKHERGDDVPHPDGLVRGDREPAEEARLMLPRALELSPFALVVDLADGVSMSGVIAGSPGIRAAAPTPPTSR